MSINVCTYHFVQPNHSNIPQSTDIHVNLFERLNIATNKKKMFVILTFQKKKNLEFDYFMWKNSVKIPIASECLLNRHQCFFRIRKYFTNFIVSIGIKIILANIPNPIIKSSWFIQEFQTFCFRVKQIKKNLIIDP